ncbi:MAG: laccase domain-containing protein, partial [Bacteroidota bacterium]
KDELLNFGIQESNIEISSLCSYEEKYLHSYRRDGKNSGRALGVIAMKEK